MNRRSLLLGGLLVCACAPSRVAAPEAHENGPAWADIFDTTPELYAVVRPQTLKNDALYGAFWNVLLRAAEVRGFTRGSTMVEAVGSAKEIVVGLNRGDDAAIVLRGVSANLDPLAMNDESGHPLFRLLDDRGKVPEYALLDVRSAEIGSLFVLPDRTWVGALGDARMRARQAFLGPRGRPAPRIDREALVALRLGGQAARAFDRGPRLSLVTQKMTSITFALEPNRKGLLVSLSYGDPDASARGELQAKRLVEDLAKDETRFGWLKDATVKYEGDVVHVRAHLPPRLLEELPRASFTDL